MSLLGALPPKSHVFTISLIESNHMSVLHFICNNKLKILYLQ